MLFFQFCSKENLISFSKEGLGVGQSEYRMPVFANFLTYEPDETI